MVAVDMYVTYSTEYDVANEWIILNEENKRNREREGNVGGFMDKERKDDINTCCSKVGYSSPDPTIPRDMDWR